MKKLALLLTAALVVFAVLAYGKERSLAAAAADQAASEALLGPRAGGMVINAPSQATEASASAAPAAAAPGQVAIPASSAASSGSGCP